MSLHYGYKLLSILAGAVLPTLHSHVICKNWYLCGVCWEDWERKNLHAPPPQRWKPPSPEYLKWCGGNDWGAFSIAVAGRLPPPNSQASLGLSSRGNSSQFLGVEAKQQLTGKSDITKTCVANSSVELGLQPDNTINSSALTPSTEHPNTLPSNHGPAEGTRLLDPAPPASIHGTALSAPTPPIPVKHTPDPLVPAQLSPSHSPYSAMQSLLHPRAERYAVWPDCGIR